LDYRTYGFVEEDLDRTFHIDFPFFAGLLTKKKDWKLRELLDALELAYCSHIGVEFTHLSDKDGMGWIREKFEGVQFDVLDEGQKLEMYARINMAQCWGDFMAQKFNTTKRFGIEGLQSFIPGFKFCVDTAVANGAETFVMGMAHRGRLQTLAHVLKKPKDIIMAELQGISPDQELSDGFQGSGDAKYHLGTTLHRQHLKTGKRIKLTMLANPSHLETVNPVVVGRCRAEQHFTGGTIDCRKKVVPI